MSAATDPVLDMTIGDAYRAAMAAMSSGQFDRARSLCAGIIAVTPKQPDVFHLLGGIEFKAGNLEAALANFRKVLALDPEHAEAHLNVGIVHRALGQWKLAAAAFAEAETRITANAPVLLDLASAHVKAGDVEAALKACSRVLMTHPLKDIVETECASLLFSSGQFEAARIHFNAVLSRSPNFVPALLNLALIRDRDRDIPAALALRERALEADPSHIEGHFHHALGLLTLGRLKDGWNEYVWRFKRPLTTTLHDRFALPYWNGEPLAGRHLLVWTEQGPGDEILLAGMLPDLTERGARVTLVCSPRLAPLFRRSFPSIVTHEQALAGVLDVSADWQASLSHLGAHLRPTTTFKASQSYLKADPSLTAQFRDRYCNGDNRPLVGIAWHSANQHAEAEKSTALSEWAGILQQDHVRFVSLQYGAHDAQIEAAQAGGAPLIVDPSVDALKDMDRFAAQVAAMDLVISVSNTTVHVAGALGRPVWTLVPASIGRVWYWLLERADSPWYPSVRLYRQPAPSDWASPLAAIANDLRAFC